MARTGTTQALRVDGEQIEYEDAGTGEPILLVHAGAFSDWFAPVAATAELNGFRVIRLRRAGYVNGSVPSRHLSIAEGRIWKSDASQDARVTASAST